MKTINIGEIIHKVVGKSGQRVEDVARRVGLTRGGLNKIFKKHYVDTDFLEKLSKVLDHDFFADFSSHLSLKEPDPRFGFASKDDFQELIRLIQKIDSRMDTFEKRLDKVETVRITKQAKGKSARKQLSRQK